MSTYVCSACALVTANGAACCPDGTPEECTEAHEYALERVRALEILLMRVLSVAELTVYLPGFSALKVPDDLIADIRAALPEVTP